MKHVCISDREWNQGYFIMRSFPYLLPKPSSQNDSESQRNFRPGRVQSILHSLLSRLFYSPYLRAVFERAEFIVAQEQEFSRDFKIEIYFLFFLDRLTA